jgi:hypothetical protein
VALIEKLESVTESLKSQSEPVQVSPATVELVERLENIAVRSAAPAIEPVVPVGYEFAKASQPLVGVIDTGFAGNNPDIDYSRIILGQERVDGDANPLLEAGESDVPVSPALEIIGATQNNGTGIDGINDDAPLFAARAGGSSEQWAQSLIEFVDAVRKSGQPNGIVTLNLNLTQLNSDGSVTPRYELTDAEWEALAYAHKHNVLVVVPAGDDSETMSALGEASLSFDSIMTVGAAKRVRNSVALSNACDEADYSGSGYALDMVADGSSGETSGTSVAASKVAGAASQVWAANPKLSYRQVMDILQRTATDLNTPNWDEATGAGLLNMAAAVHLAKVTPAGGCPCQVAGLCQEKSASHWHYRHLLQWQECRYRLQPDYSGTSPS